MQVSNFKKKIRFANALRESKWINHVCQTYRVRAMHFW